MATLYKTNNEISEVSPKNGTDYTLDELQGFVGGSIEIVPLGKDIMVVNEEGLIYGLPLNVKASEITGMPIVGDVLVCKNEEVR